MNTGAQRIEGLARDHATLEVQPCTHTANRYNVPFFTFQFLNTSLINDKCCLALEHHPGACSLSDSVNSSSFY